MADKAKGGGKKRVRKDEAGEGDESADDEHKKKLARNRAAASRCREKKKQKLQDLDQQATQLKAFNSQMESEISSLQEEINHLKAIRAQRGTGVLNMGVGVNVDNQQQQQQSFNNQPLARTQLGVSTGILEDDLGGLDGIDVEIFQEFLSH
eukprot:m.339565 g.339565  ORF g.339565 m.339565 type:complete len:151 (+) comp18868_c0_seq1:142-594(+)